MESAYGIFADLCRQRWVRLSEKRDHQGLAGVLPLPDVQLRQTEHSGPMDRPLAGRNHRVISYLVAVASLHALRSKLHTSQEGTMGSLGSILFSLIWVELASHLGSGPGGPEGE
jgi:hypothetical protein